MTHSRLKDFLDASRARAARPVTLQPAGQQCIPQQPQRERAPYPAPTQVQFGSAPLDRRFDPCGAGPMPAESLGDSK